MNQFIANHGGGKVTGGALIPVPQIYGSQGDHDVTDVDLGYEEPGEWKPIRYDHATGWEPGKWEYSPVRFVDGKDVGKIAARLFSSEGWPIPIRLSMIGAIAMRLSGRDLVVERKMVEHAVTMIVQPFPWSEVEEFAIHLQQDGLRLLAVQLDENTPVWDGVKLGEAVNHRSSQEMSALEELVLSCQADEPTIVDGLLQTHSGGFDMRSNPVFGVIKSHHYVPLDLSRRKLLYQLAVGERLPAFVHAAGTKPRALTWYMKIAEGGGQSDLDGIVRVEVALEWYERCARDTDFVNLLSKTVKAYRCRNHEYSRSNISLDPVVLGERRLSAAFGEFTHLLNHFYYLSRIN